MDDEGCEYLVQLGGDRPPVYEGTSEPVITPRLRAHLNPVELAWWSGKPLLRYLTHRAYWLTDGSEIDGWDPADFASDVLEKAASVDSFTRPALSTWMQQEISRRRKRSSLLRLEALYQEDEFGDEYLAYDVEQPDFIPSILPNAVIAWLRANTTPRIEKALTLMAVEGYSQGEAAKACGISQQAISQALMILRDKMEEQ